MAWIEFSTDADFLATCASPEMAALRSSATGTGQTDPLAAMAAAVVSEIRAYVAGNRRNKLDAVGTIPAECKAAAMDVFRFRATLRLPGVKMLQDDARRLAYTNAITFLSAIAAGTVAIEQPATPATIDTASVPNPSTGDIRETFDPTEFDGM